jgi:competence protein ComEC
MAGAQGSKSEARGASLAPGLLGWNGPVGILRGAPGHALGRASDFVRARFAHMVATEVAERRLFLWLPVFFGIGILAYFSSESEPALAAPLAAFALMSGLAWSARRAGRMKWAATATAFAFVFAGFSAGALRTWTVSAPVLDHIRVAKVTAMIETVDDRYGGGRLLLRVGSIDGLEPQQVPGRIRVTIRNHTGLRAGMTIRATMRLVPPARPSEPGGYDFAREAFFQGIGAVGSVLSRVEQAPAFDVSLVARINAFIDRGRNDLTNRIAGVIGGGDGAVAAALVTGKRGLITEEATDTLRGAGIYHVVSISGLHMVLAAGLFLWTLRALFALMPSVALNYPVKKWAAGFAMLGAVAYDVFAGSEVATERSLIMVVVMLGAVLVDRPALSMRNLAISALLVMAREPETIMGPSFQMSFGAVAAMIAMFERSGGDVSKTDVPQGFFIRMRRTVGIMLLTTFVAGFATGPFASFHFHRINPYSLIGNSLTLPLVEFVVMPAAVLGVAIEPFGLDAPVWTVMGWGISGMMELSRYVAALDGSTRYVTAFGGGALLLMSLALVWLTLWRTPIRYFGIVFVVAGLGVAARYRAPDLVVDATGRTVASRGSEARFEVMNGKGNAFAVSQWLLGDGDRRLPTAPGLAGTSRCDKLGCISTLVDGRTVALVLEPAALLEDCGRADVLVTRLRVANICKGPELLLDGAHFATHGSTELRIAADGTLEARPSRRPEINRPWSPQPVQAVAASTRKAEPARGEDMSPEALERDRDTDDDPGPFMPD